MGNDVSQPVCTKMVANEKAGTLRFGVSEMQGWRDAMEDAFVAKVVMKNDSPEHPEFAVFGIFDGHGGGHVARFVAHHIVTSLLNSESFLEGTLDECIRDSFHDVDRKLTLERNFEELYMWASLSHHDYQQSYSPLTKVLAPAPLRSVVTTSTTNDPEEDGTTGVAGGDMEKLPVTIAELPDMTIVRLDPVVCGQEFPQRAALHRCLFDTKHPTKKRLNRPHGKSSDSISQLKYSPEDNSDDDRKQGGAWWSSKLQKLMRFRPSFSLKMPSSSFIPASRNTQLLSHSPAALTGCTGVMAVITADQIIVGNAGDSRCVLCRNGRAIELSQDHKPNLPLERDRILRAGGYIEMGRVNGNLNLTRALGDLTYKQDLKRTAEEQIVTGCPDVHVVDRNPGDEFLILGCDGIWESMSSQQVVDFVRARIDKSEQLSDALDMLLDALLSPNPSLVEFGCDNMTAILVDFRPEQQPHVMKFTRSYTRPLTKVSQDAGLNSFMGYLSD